MPQGLDGLVTAVVVMFGALLSSTLGAVAGFGGVAVILPFLVWAFGVRDAIPILTVAQLIGNGSRAAFNWRQLDFRVVAWFALGAVPMSIAGAAVFAIAPAPFLRHLLGAFLLLTVAYRHTKLGHQGRVGVRGFAALGAVLGFLSGILGSVGPLLAPFLLSYGLLKGAFIGTAALTAVVMNLVKLPTYYGFGLVSPLLLATGIGIGIVMIFGSYLGKVILRYVPERVFPLLVEAVLVVSGVQFLVFG